MAGSSLEETTTADPHPPQRVVALGSTKNLEHTQYFWSGKTLETLGFNDRRSWVHRTHINGQHPLHPSELHHKTTLQDIIDIIKSLDHPVGANGVRHLPVFQVNPDGTNNLHVYPDSHGWVLVYLAGDDETTLAFRQAMLDRFPPPPGNDYHNTCTVLEMFVRGVDRDLRKRLGRLCPPRPKPPILVLMKVHNQIPIRQAEGFVFYSSYE